MELDTRCFFAAMNRKIVFCYKEPAFGAFWGMAILAFLSSANKQPLLIAPFGATCLLVFTCWDSDYAQPRNIIAGHFISGLFGLLCLVCFGQVWWSYAIAVGTAILMMQITHCTHPPAASNPILLIMKGENSWFFLIEPLLAGCIVLVVTAYVFHRFIARRKYPRYWWQIRTASRTKRQQRGKLQNVYSRKNY
ncbi:HPP family protein [Anaerospora hongkongensis]|uniref:HPP family protein n=1 Tax=Anaerospora hongkongensis TaxID=244830 RepID=A0A4R1Q071_9FIRM|nr:HPP family protein [Anaerospora hongkongensis]TCL38835.1 HPP family protein [Anaerospora hongkongensis]